MSKWLDALLAVSVPLCLCSKHPLCLKFMYCLTVSWSPYNVSLLLWVPLTYPLSLFLSLSLSPLSLCLSSLILILTLSFFLSLFLSLSPSLSLSLPRSPSLPSPSVIEYISLSLLNFKYYRLRNSKDRNIFLDNWTMSFIKLHQDRFVYTVLTPNCKSAMQNVKNIPHFDP